MARPALGRIAWVIAAGVVLTDVLIYTRLPLDAPAHQAGDPDTWHHPGAWLVDRALGWVPLLFATAMVTRPPHHAGAPGLFRSAVVLIAGAWLWVRLALLWYALGHPFPWAAIAVGGVLAAGAAAVLVLRGRAPRRPRGDGAA